MEKKEQSNDQKIILKEKKLLKPLKFTTNDIFIDFKNINMNIYVYECELIKENKIVEFNTDLYNLFMIKIVQNIANVFGYHVTLDKTVYSIKNFEKDYYFYQKIQWRSQYIQLKLRLKKIKYINIKHLLLNTYENEKKEKIIKLFNICSKNKLKKIVLAQPRHENQIKKEDSANKQPNFILKQGFVMNINFMKNFYFLQIQVVHRVIKYKTIYQQIKNIKQKQKINEMLIDKYAICNYHSNNKKYRIVEIDYNQNPTSKFKFKDNKQSTYVQFYKNNYNIIIKDQSQPLIKVILKNYKDKGQLYGYMVPQLISVQINKYMYKDNIQFKKQLSKINQITQEQKIKSQRKVVEKINSNEKYLKLNNNLYVDGYVAIKAKICLKNKQIQCNQHGKIQRLDDLLYQTPSDIKFALIYSQSNGKNRQINDILGQIMNAAKKYGIKLDPYHLKMKDKSGYAQWIQSISKQYKNKQVPKLFVYIFRQSEQSYYSKIKAFTINNLQRVSQVIRTRNFIKNKKRAATACKIIIQMCVKINYMPWKVIPQHPFFENKNIIYGALVFSKGKNGQFFSFVGTTNNECTKYFNTFEKIQKNFSQVSIDILEQIFTDWIKIYYKTEKKLPDSILIYRKGIQQSKAKQKFEKCEIKAIENTITQVKKRTKKQKYCPGYQFVLVQQRTRTRFNYFENSEQAKTIKNPLPGSIITFSNLEENFQMISKYSPHGGYSPIKYKGGYGRPNIPSKALIMFTWEQCHNYYNSQGSIRVPACIQYAKKLLNFITNDEKIKQNQETKTKLFYI